MRRRAVSRTAVAAVCLALLSGCAGKPTGTAPAISLTWNSTAVTGAPYYYRRMGGVTVHYSRPTLPEQAEVLATMVSRLLDSTRGWQQWGPDDRLDLWMIPAGATWPAGAPELPASAAARAIRPHVVLVLSSFIPEQMPTKFTYPLPGIQAFNNGILLPASFAVSDLSQAVAIAVTQNEGSPAYRTDWLHDGLGMLLATNWQAFPNSVMATSYASMTSVAASWTAAPMLEILESPQAKQPTSPFNYQQAAATLAGLVADRFGIDWLETVPNLPEHLEPREVLRWATDAASDQEALSKADDRMARVVQLANKVAGKVQLEPVTLADQGLNRIQPPAVSGKMPTPDNTPRYALDVRWNPATHSVTGREQMTWTSTGDSPLKQLYFDVWGNADFVRRSGGRAAIESVSVNGEPAAYEFQGMDLVVSPSRPVRPGEAVTTEIQFTTQLPYLPTAASKWLPKAKVTSQADAQAERWSLSYWFPTLELLDPEGWHPTSFPLQGAIIMPVPSGFHVWVTLPKSTRIVRLGSSPQSTAAGADTTYEFPAVTGFDWNADLLIQQPRG